jgi:hypothetical protein
MTEISHSKNNKGRASRNTCSSKLYIKYKADLERKKMNDIKIDNTGVKFKYKLEKKSLIDRIRKK